MLLAQNQGGGRLAELLEPGLWLAGILLAGAVVLMLVSALRKRGERGLGKGDAAEDQLSQFRAMYEQGEMSESEYKRIQAALSARRERVPPPSNAGGPPEEPPQRMDEPRS